MSSFSGARALILGAMAGVAAVLAPQGAGAHPNGMVTGAVTSQPIGHYEFCQRFRSECAIRPADQTLHPASVAFLDELKQVTTAVNKAVKPMSDMDLYGTPEFWTYPDGAGDCEDYALQKQKILSERGVSLANLLITVLRKRDGEGHAVLTVRTDGGDFVLDNLNDEVMPWRDTGYTYLKRQASDHMGRWVKIEDTAGEPLVSSVE